MAVRGGFRGHSFQKKTKTREKNLFFFSFIVRLGRVVMAATNFLTSAALFVLAITNVHRATKLYSSSR